RRTLVPCPISLVPGVAFPVFFIEASAFRLPQPPSYCAALQFAQRVCRDPSRRARVLLPNPFCQRNCRSIQVEIAFADVAQRPVPRFANEVALIVRLSLNQTEAALEALV